MKAGWISMVLSCLALVSQGQTIRFNKTFGGGYFDEARGVTFSSDSGYVICGATSSFGASFTDVFLFKLDTLGDEIWKTHFGWEGNDKAYDILTAETGGFLMTGIREVTGNGYDMFLAETNADGDTVWTKTYGGSDWDFAYSLDTTFDGGMVVAGETYSYGNGNADGIIFKTNATGDTIWQTVLGGPQDDGLRMVFESYDSTIYAIGTTSSFGAGGSDVWLVALSQNGDTLFTKTYGTTADEFGYSLDDYFDGGGVPFLMLGTSYYATESGLIKPRMIRVATDGFLVYQLDYISNSNNQEEDKIIVRRYPNLNNSFYYIGQQRFDTDDNNFNLKFSRSLSGGYYGNTVLLPNAADQRGTDILYTHDKGYLLVGYTSLFGPGTQAAVIVKYDSLENTDLNTQVGLEDILSVEGASVFPNPVQSVLHISMPAWNEYSLRIFNELSQEVYTRYVTGSMHEIQVEDWKSGVYVAEFTHENQLYRLKFIRN